MLIDIQQLTKEKLIKISHYNSEGNVSIKTYPVPEFKNWVECKENDKNKSKEWRNWNGGPIKLQKALSYNSFSLTYFLNGLPEEDLKEIFSFHQPKTYFVDIETEITEGFAKPEEAQNKILSFSIVTPKHECIILGLKDLSPLQIQEIEDDTGKYFEKYDEKWKVKFIKFDNEVQMIKTFLIKFLPNMPMMTGWNFTGYDWTYIVNRCKRLQIDLEEYSKHKALNRGDGRPLHQGIIDYMELYIKYDRSVKVKESNTLDYVAEQVTGLKKIQYTGDLQSLYESDYKKYMYYNAVDSILVYYIHKKLQLTRVMYSIANSTKISIFKAMSPVALTESILALKMIEDKKKIGTPIEKRKIPDEVSYPGAFVKEPVVGFYKGVAGFDFASLYPSIMRQFNISPDSYIKTIDVDDIEKERENKDVIVCVNGAVFDGTKDSILKKLITDMYAQRKEYKKMSYDYYSLASKYRELAQTKN